MKKFLGIKDWAQDDRPREKLLAKGKGALSDAELLAIVMGSGSYRQSAVELAKEMLHHMGNDLSGLAKKNWEDLQRFRGVGQAKAAAVVAAFELGRRRQASEAPILSKLTSAKMVYEQMRSYFTDMQHEEFHILLLNRRSEMIRFIQVSSGGSSGTIVDGKIIFKKAIDHAAQAIILMHNHPSGNLKPSEKDLYITSQLVRFGGYIDLPVLDHIIFGDNGYFSFADNGLI